MIIKYLPPRDLIFTVPVSMAIGAFLSILQPGTRANGFILFSLLLFVGISLLCLFARWVDSGKMVLVMTLLAFGLRLIGGVAFYNLLPLFGYDDLDDQAGFIYTDAHRRDSQAWELATSDDPILDAFSSKFSTDQYGGLLAFGALAYRYLSPDSHRPFVLVLITAFIAALGLPCLWKSIRELWSEKVAKSSGWIYVLYPECILLGGTVMREPYLITLSTFALLGFVTWTYRSDRSGWYWLGSGLLGMLLISPVAFLMTTIILGGWLYFENKTEIPSRWMIIGTLIVFVVGIAILSGALLRQGQLSNNSPFGILGGYLRDAVNWDVYQLERGSGWVQKLFEEMPEILHLPFVVIYGIFQPVLPAALVEPTTSIWQTIAIIRSMGWYILLPLLVLSFVASYPRGSQEFRRLWLWLSLVTWFWIIFAALRGGGDQWDNPRYRTILFLWQAILAGNVWVWWRASRNPWVFRVLAMEAVFLIIFGQWYLSRYLHLGNRLEFSLIVTIILLLWMIIFLVGWLWDRGRLTVKDESL